MCNNYKKMHKFLRKFGDFLYGEQRNLTLTLKIVTLNLFFPLFW